MHWMNRNEWFIEWSGMNDSMNEQELLMYWMNRNEWFMEWTGINDLMNEQE